jgi:hypothetical protein
MSACEYEVEKIVRHRVWRGQTFFLLQWSGFPSSENNWEPEENVSEELVAEYRALQKMKASSHTNPHIQVKSVLSVRICRAEILYTVKLENGQSKVISSKELKKTHPELIAEFLGKLKKETTTQ